MIKLWVCLLSVLIGAWVLEPLPAEGACTESRIEVLTRPLVIGPTFPVTWQIIPPCEVIETGLLLGTDPSTLEPAGERIFGLRSPYHQVISVSETRVYWIAAYALISAAHGTPGTRVETRRWEAIFCTVQARGGYRSNSVLGSRPSRGVSAAPPEGSRGFHSATMS